MMSNIRGVLYKNSYLKGLANSLYVYMIFLFHVLLNMLPGVLRVLFFRPFLRSCGKKVMFDHNVYIKFPWLVEIGDSVVLNRGVEIYCDYFSKATVTIGSNVRVAPNVRLHASGHEVESGEYYHKGDAINIGNNVWIGAAAIILPGVTVGEGSVVAAGSVVTKNVPDHSLVAGVPARIKRRITRDEGQ
ncbi:DapH/DapD/GlmU-related protein [uncultured Marinobacter sp.]|uniref:acyltransferase n=1 Tax=uncultured Marinobacter sp. TaxID=187379 RepID=UPI0026313AA8|nr:DapH/DapD/GlmU-related protein [uncultured Marinobacter sp.]